LIDHQLTLKHEWNTRRNFLARAHQISNEYRPKFGMLTLDEETSRIVYNDSIPRTFQGSIHQAHLFNKYLKELRERYLQ